MGRIESIRFDKVFFTLEQAREMMLNIIYIKEIVKEFNIIYLIDDVSEYKIFRCEKVKDGITIVFGSIF